jgi:hypothetical protein
MAHELKRTYQLQLTMGADTLQDLRGMLNTLCYDLAKIEDGGGIDPAKPYEAISGGYGGNHSMTLEFRPDVTHDSYFEQLEAHLAEKREG